MSTVKLQAPIDKGVRDQWERLTIPADPNRKAVGYFINSGVSAELYRHIQAIQARVSERFSGAIWAAPWDSLHITLMDWVSPLADYGRDKDDVFASIKDGYTEVLSKALEGQRPIRITFDRVEVHPAAIIIKGQDDGSYQRIREGFLRRVELLPGTKSPPEIIHSTICKFLKEIDVSEVAEFMRNESLRFQDGLQEEITEFRLARETQMFMTAYEVVRRFDLTKRER